MDPERGEPLRPLLQSYSLGRQSTLSKSTSFSKSQPPDFLLEAIKTNDDLEERLPNFPDDDFLHQRLYDSTYRHLLTLACEDPHVTSHTFKTLFKHLITKFPSESFNEPDWYYWQVVHFAAYHVNLEKQRVIVEVFKDEDRLGRFNALTLFSENALHVLLGYGRQVESFNVQLSNGWESRICHVIAKEKPEIVECAKLLIDAGINVNHNNIWNETPLMIAIKYRLLGVIRLLLKKPDIDVDTCKDPATGKSARDLLRENEIHLDLMNPGTTLNLDPVQTLFTYLKSDDEENFLRYNNENIRQFVDETDGCYTMLQICMVKGYFRYQRSPSRKQATAKTSSDLLKSPMLMFFCLRGFGRSAEHLLNNDAKVLEKSEVFGGLNVFQMAVKLSYYPFVAILLEHRYSQIGKEDLISELKSVDETSFSEENFNTRHVVQLLVSKLETLFQEEAYVTMQPQHQVVLTRVMDLYITHGGSSDKYKENICQLLRMGATLTGNLTATSTRLKEVSYETLKTHLDECIDANGGVSYDSFVTDDELRYAETETLHDLCHDAKKNELLNHPALLYLVHIKWLRCSKFFYINLTMYAFFLISLYCHVVSLQINRPNDALKAVFIAFLSVQLFKEFVQLILYWRRYFYDLSNYLELLAIGCCVVNVFGRNEHAMVVAILMSSCIFLLTAGQLPKFTKYMIVFSSTKYFLEYAAFYFIQFVSFALCFFILLPPEGEEHSGGVFDALGTISLRLFQTLIFFIGQYDGDINSVPKFPVFGRFIVAVFIFCMTIILNNLLVGLIVTDMDVIQKNGKLQRQVKMIRFITRIERFLERIEGILKQTGLLRRCRWMRKCYVTKVFDAGSRKTVEGVSANLEVFDDEDRAWMRRIHENRAQPKNVLGSLYEYIVAEINSDHKSLKENRDILFKLSRLEEHIRRGRPG